LKEFLEKKKSIELADLSYTLKTGRNNFKYRNFVICKDTTDAAHQLEKIVSHEPLQVREKKGIVFMFSGQGSQYYKMGKQIYLQYPYFKSIMDEGFVILKNETGIDYTNVIGYNDSKDSENDLINDTCYTQPLLFLLEYAFAKLLLKLGVKPSHMIGHSLGEYVAACISEVFTFDQGLKLIVKRAQLMNEMERGSMLSVDLSADKVIEFISSDLSIAAINTENSCVISGSTRSINLISDLLTSKEIPFAKLKTSHAFHSQMMDPIREAYEMELNKINFSEPKYSFISCTTGVAIKKEEAVSPKYWVNHLKETVNLSKGLDFLLKDGHSIYIEIGSAKILLSFLRQNKNYSSDLGLTAVLKHPKETMDDSYYLLNALGTLWSSGIDIHWNEYYSGEYRNKISAPAYLFDKIIFPSKVNPIQKFIELNKLDLKNEINKNSHSHEFTIKDTLESMDTFGGTTNQDAERPNVKSLYKEAQTETERKLCELFKSLFGYEKIGMNDDFFELGGDSLKVMTLIKRIHKSFNIEISIGDFFKRSNIEELAKEIDLALEFKEINKSINQPTKSNQIRL
jgi:acyl transferase domain-containing protein/acyl carrier protein